MSECIYMDDPNFQDQLKELVNYSDELRKNFTKASDRFTTLQGLNEQIELSSEKVFQIFLFRKTEVEENLEMISHCIIRNKI